MAIESTASASLILEMARSDVWSRMRDLHRAKFYVPRLVDCRLTTVQHEGVGASRRVYMRRSELDETVTEWQEGRGFVLRLHRGVRPPFPFASAFCRYGIEDEPESRTRFRISLTYVMRGGRLGALLDRALIKPMMDKSMLAVAVNLKRYYESDQPVNKVLSMRQVET